LENIDHQILVYQMLKGLSYFPTCGLIHRDLKPRNILVNADLSLKICDFGLSRGLSEGMDANYTEYVVTRHYRAPEVMTNQTKYDEKIDLWGIGCILAELLGREVLFQGQDYLGQLQLIIQQVGSPSEEDLEPLHPNARKYISGLGHVPKREWKDKYPTADPLALDLVDRLLQFNPSKRPSAAEALVHPWFDSMKKDDAFKELKILSEDKKPSQAMDFGWEKPKMKKEELVDLLLFELYIWRPELKAKLAGAAEAPSDPPAKGAAAPGGKAAAAAAPVPAPAPAAAAAPVPVPAPVPAPAPVAPAPAPVAAAAAATPAVAPQSPGGGSSRSSISDPAGEDPHKKRGLLDRMFGRNKGGK